MSDSNRVEHLSGHRSVRSERGGVEMSTSVAVLTELFNQTEMTPEEPSGSSAPPLNRPVPVRRRSPGRRRKKSNTRWLRAVSHLSRFRSLSLLVYRATGMVLPRGVDRTYEVPVNTTLEEPQVQPGVTRTRRRNRKGSDSQTFRSCDVGTFRRNFVGTLSVESVRERGPECLREER